MEDKENQLLRSQQSRPSSDDKLRRERLANDKANLRKSDSGDIDYLELNDDNIQLLKIKPDPNLDLKRTDSQQSIVDLVKRSASISMSNTSLNRITYKRQEEEEAKRCKLLLCISSA